MPHTCFLVSAFLLFETIAFFLLSPCRSSSLRRRLVSAPLHQRWSRDIHRPNLHHMPHTCFTVSAGSFFETIALFLLFWCCSSFRRLSAPLHQRWSNNIRWSPRHRRFIIQRGHEHTRTGNWSESGFGSLRGAPLNISRCFGGESPPRP